MIKYKIDVVDALVKAGWTNKRLKETGYISQSTIHRLKTGACITTDTLSIICAMLRLQPGDILESVPTDEEKIKFF